MKKRIYFSSIVIASIFIVIIVYTAYFKMKLANSESGIRSIASALHQELGRNNNTLKRLFLKDKENKMRTLSSKEYYQIMTELSRHYFLDISKDKLDPWGDEYVIQYQIKNNHIYLRVFSKTLQENERKYGLIEVREEFDNY